MKAKSIICAITALAMLNLNGCATLLAWGHNDPTSTSYHYQDAGSDNVRAFGMVQKDVSPLKTGQLVMMGDKYWYALTQQDSADLSAVMNAKLAQRYRIFRGDNQQELTAMPVTIEENGKRFFSRFCLHYQPQNAQETATIQSLKFTALDKQPAIYSRCFNGDGDLFAKPATMQADYQFEQAVPVQLTVRTEHTEVDGGKLVENVLGTPVTLAIDAVGTVLMLPFGLLGVLMGR